MEKLTTQQNKNQQGPPPENYLIWAILTTVMCCMPLGVISIIKSSMVKELWAKGDHFGAHRAAKEAKKYAIWSAVSLPIIMVLLFVFSILMSLLGILLEA